MLHKNRSNRFSQLVNANNYFVFFDLLRTAPNLKFENFTLTFKIKLKLILFCSFFFDKLSYIFQIFFKFFILTRTILKTAKPSSNPTVFELRSTRNKAEKLILIIWYARKGGRRESERERRIRTGRKLQQISITSLIHTNGD